MKMAEKIVLIGDERIKKIHVHDTNEAIVDLKIKYTKLTFDFTRKNVQKDSLSISFGRLGLGLKLLEAQKILPQGLSLLIKECYRPIQVQQGFWVGETKYLRKKFPLWTEKEIYDECSKFVAPLDVAPHTTGGAVDLTLIDDQGLWLDMGTEFNASSMETKDATYTFAKNISTAARENRNILIEVMTQAGFVNYPTEWWHWSYGDKYWAYMQNKPCAIYGSLDVDLN